MEAWRVLPCVDGDDNYTGVSMAEGNEQQSQQEQQSPLQRIQRALAEIRKVQHMMEMNYPNREDAIKMLRNAGDLVWQEIQEKQEQQQQ